MNKHCPVTCSGEVTKTLKVEKEKDGECKDFHPRCPIWQSLGECEENPRDMNRFCRKSCKVCSQHSDVDVNSLCVDQEELCSFWASKGECKANPTFMHQKCAKSCNKCEELTRNLDEATMDAGPHEVKDSTTTGLLDWSENVGVRQTAIGSEKIATLQKIQASKHYWESEAAESLPKDLLDRCRNQNELCSFWAYLGECEKNSAYMATNCGPACNTCHLIDIKTRCPPLEDPKPGLRPGALNKMFERIVATAPGNNTEDKWTDEVRKNVKENQTPLYTVHVHSRPSDEPATEVDPVMDKSLPPWVITFENFMTEEECEQMIALGHEYEYKRSEDVGEEKADGSFGAVQSSRRTSENAWCSTHVGCRERDLPTRLHNRIAEVLQIAPENSEDFQILRYEHNQFYR